MISGVKIIEDMVPVPSGVLQSGDLFEMARPASPNNFTYSTSIDNISTYIQNSVSSSYGNMFFNNNSRPTTYSTPLPSINRIEAGPTVPPYPPANYSGYGAGLLSNFTLSNGRLIYNGTDNIVAQIECSLQIFCNGPLTGNPQICIRRNSTIVAFMPLHLTGDALVLNGSLNTLVTLVTGNNIDIAIDNIDTVSYTVTTLQVTITPVINLGTTLSSTTDLQEAYDNGNGSISLTSGKPFTLNSTTAGFLMPQMTQVQFTGIPLPDNGLIAWANDSNRIIVNYGTSGSPGYDVLAYLGDLSIINLQTAYNNGDGYIVLTAGKPFALYSDVAGFLPPQMTLAEFEAIPSPDHGLMAWADDSNRIIVNSERTGSPSYDLVAYLADVDGVTLQQAYDNGNGKINLITGKPFELDSTVAGFLMPRMTNSQFLAISPTTNGLMGWITDGDRIIVNTGSNISPFFNQVAYLSDISIIPTLQDAYTNGNGKISLLAGKPFELDSTVAGFLMPKMTETQFQAITSPANGLISWATNLNRFTVNKGTSGTPSYDQLAYLSEATLQGGYTNGTGQISLLSGKPFQLNSTVAGFIMPRMTQAQFVLISPTTNGLMGWDTDNDRIIINTGSNITPFFNEVAYLSDISQIPTLQDAYNNGNGKINLITGKPFELDSTVAGFLPPQMTQIQFQAITSPANGLLAWDTFNNRVTVNKGTAGTPSYDLLAYYSEATLQGVYTNGTGSIVLTAGKPFQLNSTVAGFVMPRMTEAQFVLIPVPVNGLMGWDTDNDRIIVNTGSNVSPFFNEVAYLSDISQIPTLQDAYTNGNGKINLITDKPFELDSTVAGFLMPAMTETQFQAITSPANGLISWATNLNRFTVNKGTSGTPSYDQLAYLSEATLEGGYTNGTGQISLLSGKPFQLTSTVAGFIPPKMTTTQFQTISSPTNGLMAWSNSLDRIIVNSGTPGSPVYSHVAYTSDIPAAPTLQDTYDNGDGAIILTTGKPFYLSSTVAGFVLPNMTNAQFLAISPIVNSLIAYDTTNHRIIVNSGTNITPIYSQVAWTSDLALMQETLQAQNEIIKNLNDKIDSMQIQMNELKAA